MDENFKKKLKKANMFYCGELLLFSVIFIVLGILKLLQIIGNKGWFREAFIYVTLAGATWTIIDFIWLMCSKKRKAKNCILDKALLLVVPPVLYYYDISALIYKSNGGDLMEFNLYHYIFGAIFLYFAVVYLIQAIYHYKKPLPSIYQAVYEEIEEEKRKALEKEQLEANKIEEENTDKMN